MNRNFGLLATNHHFKDYKFRNWSFFQLWKNIIYRRIKTPFFLLILIGDL